MASVFRVVMEMNLVLFDAKYRDDLIFMILEAKNALGKVPRLNDDLLDIEHNYFSNGDAFWIALDDNDRVIGSIGYTSVENSDEVWLHRLYVKYNLKRTGIGTALLQAAETHLKQIGKTAAHVHLGDDLYFESHHFYPKHGYVEYAPHYLKKLL